MSSIDCLDPNGFARFPAHRGSRSTKAARGYIATNDYGTANDAEIKGFSLRTSGNVFDIYTSLGFLLTPGGASTSGPVITATDGGSYTRYWHMTMGTGVIQTASGNISPVASDERVKNIVREIGEEEAVRFIERVKPIRYAFKWSPDEVRVGYRAQNIYDIDPELIQRMPLTLEDKTIEDGMVVDSGEVAAAFLLPVVQQLLRRISKLEEQFQTSV